MFNGFSTEKELNKQNSSRSTFLVSHRKLYLVKIVQLNVAYGLDETHEEQKVIPVRYAG